jgi:tagaturonate reductase
MGETRWLQFGTGRFLRAFAGAFVQEANDGSRPGGRRAITIVESTGSGTAARLAAQGCRYRLLVRGLRDGAVVDSSRVIESADRAVDGTADPAAVLAAAVDPAVTTIVSNTTEAGYAAGPDGFPARLLEVLVARARAGLPGVTILPCELVERNGDRLRELVLAELAHRPTDPAVTEHVRDANAWAVTLVDRIVTTPAPDLPGVAGDPLAVAAEPFALWVVEASDDAGLVAHPAVRCVPDVGSFALRKIRILNGAHTALVARTRGGPFTFVREAMADPATAAWLEALLREEIVPAIDDRIEDGAGFTAAVMERFRNPFLDHRLADIALHHDAKLGTRLVPTLHDFVARFGRRPPMLSELLEREGAL